MTGHGLDSLHVIKINQIKCKVLSACPDGTEVQFEVPPAVSY
jgi:hypothetical protein